MTDDLYRAWEREARREGHAGYMAELAHVREHRERAEAHAARQTAALERIAAALEDMHVHLHQHVERPLSALAGHLIDLTWAIKDRP